MENQKRIYLAVYDHKHGQDKEAYSTYKDAEEQLRQWAVREYAVLQRIGTWIPYFPGHENPTPDQLISNWSDITGHTEFFTIETLHVRNYLDK